MTTKDIIDMIMTTLISSGVMGAIGTVIVSKFKSASKKVTDIVSDVDYKQNKQLSEISAIIKKGEKKEKFNDDLLDGIENTVFDIIDLNSKKIDDKIISLIIFGGDEAFKFFKRIHEKGYKKINIEHIHSKAINIFDKLRYHNPDYDVEESKNIRANIALPALNKLEQDLIKIKRGDFNGTSDKEFITFATNFVAKVINGTINMYIKNDAA